MGIVERYILRGSFVAFAASLTVLTAIVWVSQALREVELQDSIAGLLYSAQLQHALEE